LTAALPPPPPIPTRPSTPFILIGNALLAILLLLLAGTDLSPWIVCLAALPVLFVLGYKSGGRSHELKAWFTGPRFAEVRPHFFSDDEATAQVEQDFKAHVDLQPLVLWVATIGFVLTLSAPYLIFVEANAGLGDWHWLVRVPIAAAAALGAFILFLGIWAFANMTPEPMRESYAELRGEAGVAQALPPGDQNDVRIIRELASLDSLHRRIETFTLESALLSALSFSTFFAVIVSDRKFLETLPGVLPPPVRWLESSPSTWQPFRWIVENVPYIPFSYVLENIVGLIGLSLLLCATTFLGVLVARLRFNEGYRDAEYRLKAAQQLNEKEDKAIESKDEQRRALLAGMIDEMLDQAVELQRGLTFTVSHMKYSRNAGILFFTITLVLCGFFFDPAVAAIIATLFVVTFLLGYVDRVFRRNILQRLFRRRGFGALLEPFRAH
jgi:hypothetical protein